MDIEQLQERLKELLTENETLKAKADAEKREFTTDEADQFDRNLSAFAAAKKNIERLQEMEDNQKLMLQGQGRKTEADQPSQLRQDDAGNVEREVKLAVGNRRIDIRPVDSGVLKNGGFRSLGDFAWAVSHACSRGGHVDPRLDRIAAHQLAAATTYGNESVGADGGFAVPPDFRNAIMQTVLAEDSLIGMCDQVTVEGNQFTCPMDETNPWQTSGGILASWESEAQAATQSKPALGERTVKLNKLRCLVPMTEESMSDASAMSSWLLKKAPEKISFKVNLAIVQGTGVGQPLGLLNSGALISVTKQSSQVADTIVGNNIIKMYSRMYAPSRRNGVWLYNQDIEPQLYKLSVPGTDDTGNAVTGWGGLIYMPPGGVSGAPYGTIFGRPTFPTQACETLGDVGDIIFVDLKQYLVVLKSGPNPRTDVSMHLWFDQDLIAFKFVLRIGGVPWWSTTQAARDGSATYSPYVTLEAR